MLECERAQHDERQQAPERLSSPLRIYWLTLAIHVGSFVRLEHRRDFSPAQSADVLEELVRAARETVEQIEQLARELRRTTKAASS